MDQGQAMEFSLVLGCNLGSSMGHIFLGMRDTPKMEWVWSLRFINGYLIAVKKEKQVLLFFYPIRQLQVMTIVYIYNICVYTFKL